MKLLLCCLLPLLATAARAQAPKLKPLHEILPAADTLTGLWVQEKPTGDEYMTFNADGRLIMTRGQSEKMQCRWKTDTTATPWKLDITVEGKHGPVTVYTVFAHPDKDTFRMATPAGDLEKRPGNEALQKSPLLLKRIPLEKHEGIHQAVEAHLKGFSGTWQGITNGSTGTVTFSADGTFTMAEGSSTDKGRFRIDVRSVPCKIDLLSTEGTGASYGLYELKDGKLRFSRAKRKPAERPADFEGAVEFVRKKD